jgi:hypothetical protein
MPFHRLIPKGNEIMSALLRFPIRRSLAAAILLGSVYTTTAEANQIIDFSTLPQESVDGVTADGVTFGYTEFGSSSPEAFFDQSVGAGNTVLVQPVALVGFADGVLTMNFASPVSEIAFPVALTTNASLTPGFSVTVFDASGDVLETENIDTTALANFSEGAFSYDGSDASSVAITFDSVGGVFQGDANQFALGSVQIPEPGSLGILTMGLMAMGAMVMRRRQA